MLSLFHPPLPPTCSGVPPLCVHRPPCHALPLVAVAAAGTFPPLPFVSDSPTPSLFPAPFQLPAGTGFHVPGQLQGPQTQSALLLFGRGGFIFLYFRICSQVRSTSIQPTGGGFSTSVCHVPFGDIISKHTAVTAVIRDLTIKLTESF